LRIFGEVLSNVRELLTWLATNGAGLKMCEVQGNQ